MKILYVTTVSITLNTFLIPHVKRLVEDGNEVEIASNIDVEIASDFIDMNVKHNKIEFCRNPFSISNKSAYSQIKELQRRESFDIVHVHTPVASFITRLALRNEKVKVVYTAHGFHFYKGAPFINWAIYYTLEKIASNWTDTIITINNEDFMLANNKFKNKRDKIYKIDGIGVDLINYSNNFSDLEEFKKSLGLKNDDFVITVIAELIKRKNHKQVLEAMKLVKESNKNVKVLLVGDGILSNEIDTYIQGNNMKDSVIRLGFRRDVNKIIAISDVIGLFSLQEGLPRNLMESMSLGKPIICTNIRGNNDMVQHYKNGILVEVNDVEGTKNAILEIYNNKNLMKKFGEISLKEVKKYGIQNVLNNMQNIYKDVESI